VRWLWTVIAIAACDGSDVSREIGARCDDSDECDDRCLLPGPEYPGGFCSVTCNSDDECPADTRCSADDGGVCLFECATDDGCAFLGDGWTCQLRDGQPDGEVMVCRGG
jgi:hypothetical protein